MNGRVCRRGKYENRYYTCTGYLQHRDCDCLSVRQTLMEDAVVAHLLSLLDEDELNRRIAKQSGLTIDLLRQEAASIKLRLGEIEQELGRVRQDYRRAKIDAATFNDLHADIEAEKTSLARNLTAKKAELTEVTNGIRGGEDVRDAVTLLESWNGLSYAQRKQVVHLLTARVQWDYHSHRVTVETTV